MKDISVDEIQTIYQQTIASAQADILLVVDTNEVIAIAVLNCVLKLNRIECRLDEAVVAPEQRGKGIGTKLIQACAKWAWERHCYQIEFTTRPERDNSVRFYEKRGYDKRDSTIYTKFSPTTDYVKTKVI